MKQACSLESMVDAVLSEMKRRGNAKNTIERHERAYSQFYEYALTQGENSYSKVLARSFLEEKEKLSAYRGPRFMEQYRIALNKLDDIAKGQDIRLRHLENGYHLKSSCFDWVIPFFEERLKRRLKNTYDVRTRLRILSLFLSFIETQNAKKLEDISINHIAAAFEASTDQNHFRSTIREFLSFAAENGWMPTRADAPDACAVARYLAKRLSALAEIRHGQDLQSTDRHTHQTGPRCCEALQAHAAPRSRLL